MNENVKEQLTEMYQICCRKCGSTNSSTRQSGIGLYCNACGAWIKWLGKVVALSKSN